MGSRKDSGAPPERPLTARSVLASTLLGVQPPVMPVRRLVETARLFGIAEGTARTALSRMAAAGEVIPENGSYRLTGPLLDRQARQAQSRHPDLQPWDGRWRTGVVVAGSRAPAVRLALRTAMMRARLAELREGVWMRPDNVVAPAFAPADRDQCRWFLGVPEGDPVELAAALWDLQGWAARADELRARLRETSKPLEQRDTSALAGCFVLSAAVLRHLQADPLLPEELLPEGWPGQALRREYEVWDQSYRAVLTDWHRSHDR